MEHTHTHSPSPETIMQVSLGFWPSKILLAAVKLDLFSILAETGGSTAMELKKRLGLRCMDRHWYDFLDTLSGFHFLERQGLLENAIYTNSANADIFLDRKKESYIGGLCIMANNRLYKFWGDLETGLQTGEAQNEIKTSSENVFDTLYQSPEALREFMHAMSGIQKVNFMQFAQKFNFSNFKTLTDIGGDGAMLSISVAKQHPGIHCINFDLPQVEPIAMENIEKAGLKGRIETRIGNFFKDDFPVSDIIVMGNILHDWSEEKKIQLIKKAYDGLTPNGAFVAIENIIDDNRIHNVFGMMMSLNMLIETGEGFDYTFSDFSRWATSNGFIRTELINLAGPASAAIAFK